jgi:hypothetical protein
VEKNIDKNIKTYLDITAKKPVLNGKILVTGIFNAGMSFYNA